MVKLWKYQRTFQKPWSFILEAYQLQNSNLTTDCYICNGASWPRCFPGSVVEILESYWCYSAKKHFLPPPFSFLGIWNVTLTPFWSPCIRHRSFPFWSITLRSGASTQKTVRKKWKRFNRHSQKPCSTSASQIPQVMKQFQNMWKDSKSLTSKVVFIGVFNFLLWNLRGESSLKASKYWVFEPSQVVIINTAFTITR